MSESNVCKHGRMRRQCADCEVVELYKQVDAQDKRIAELAEDVKLLEKLGEEYEENLTKLNEEVCKQQDEIDAMPALNEVILVQAKEIERLKDSLLWIGERSVSWDGCVSMAVSTLATSIQSEGSETP